jgi:hypothetical protein
MEYNTATRKLEFLVHAFNESTVFRSSLGHLEIAADSFLFRSYGKTNELPVLEVSEMSFAGAEGESPEEAQVLRLDIFPQMIRPFFLRVLITKHSHRLRLFTMDIQEHVPPLIPGAYFIIAIEDIRAKKSLVAAFYFYVKAMNDMFLVIQNELGPLPHFPNDKVVEQAFPSLGLLSHKPDDFGGDLTCL